MSFIFKVIIITNYRDTQFAVYVEAKTKKYARFVAHREAVSWIENNAADDIISSVIISDFDSEPLFDARQLAALIADGIVLLNDECKG